MTRNEYINLYVKWGWTVVPVVKGEKRPSVNWREYQDKKPTVKELRQWFADPDVGVGVITGKTSGIMVIDEDSYKKQGKVLDLETPLIVKSGSGGRHFYFKYKDGIKNSVNSDNAVDVRAEGGFVVLPPTIHPSGKPYEWATPPPETLAELPTLDESFANELIKKREVGERIKISDYMNLEEGSRDDSLLRVALSIVNKVEEAEAWVLINGVNSTFSPPLSDRDVERIFRQAINFVKNNPKNELMRQNLKDKKPLEVLSWPEAQAKYDDLMERYGEGVTSGYEALDSYFKLVPQQVYMLSAPTHVGKTTLVLNMAGRIVREGISVVLASLEQGVFVVPRIKSMFGDEKGLENLKIIAPDDLPNVDQFLATFEDNRPKVLIIDHLHYFERGNRGATEEMDRLVVAIQVLAKKLEIPVIAIAHVRKLNDDKPPTMEDLRDSSSLSQIPALVAMMYRKRNPEEEIAAGSSILSDEGTLYILKNRIGGLTGSENFKLLDNGEIVFDKAPRDVINKQAEPILGLTNPLFGLEDILDD